MVFPGAGPLPRHPSQLYEAILEGPVLFAILWLLKDRDWPKGAMTALFLAGYGTFRFFVEFLREPDAHIGFLIGPLTTGQVLCLIMVAAGAAWGLLLMKKKKGAM
jgi:phosphatidylglycerol:prolipoprotein diacylglycerol transferase